MVKKHQAQKSYQAAQKVAESLHETLTYCDFPDAHWGRIRRNNPLERILRVVRRRSRVVGAFPDGNSALMLEATRLRHISGTRWGKRRYLNMNLITEMEKRWDGENHSMAIA